tara:strand:- start:1005 stop:1160 length:156 start_codon:yes stop_codon:yes gene_type:complete
MKELKNETLIVVWPESMAAMKKRQRENRKLIEQGRLSEFKPTPKYTYIAVK